MSDQRKADVEQAYFDAHECIDLRKSGCFDKEKLMKFLYDLYDHADAGNAAKLKAIEELLSKAELNDISPSFMLKLCAILNMEGESDED